MKEIKKITNPQPVLPKSGGEIMINGKKFRVVKYAELTLKESALIDASLGLTKNENEIVIEVKNSDIIKRIVMPVDPKTDLNKIDFEDVKNEDLVDIFSSYIAERQSFFDGTPSLIANSALRKIEQARSTKESIPGGQGL